MFSNCKEKGVFVTSVSDKRRPNDKPNFFFRIHSPARISPLGAPLLLILVLNRRLAGKMMALGTIDAKKYEADCQRILQDAKAVDLGLQLYTHTDEGSALLRYVLHLNSTKMQRTAWQSKNLPRGEA
jgi:hypothetical protein